MSHFHHPEKELAVIGFLSGAGVRGIPNLTSVKPQHFTNPLCAIVWDAALYLHRKGKTANSLNLLEVIEADGEVSRDAIQAAQDQGIPDLLTFFASCDSSLVTVPNGGEVVGEYLAVIAEAAGSRKAADIGRRLAAGDIDRTDAVEALGGIQSAVIKPPRFADFKTILEGGFKREMPAVCEAMPGKFLLYAGRINEFHGESGIGKTNISLSVADRIMRAGGMVLFLDPEDNPQGIAQRFVSLGGDPSNLVSRFKYVHNPEPSDYPGLIEWAKKAMPQAVILDGMAEALVAEGYSEDKAEDVLPFLRQRIRPFADNGAAVVIADHVAKNKESRGRNPRGSGGKLGRYDGAVYQVELVKAYSPATAGAVRLIVAKDRNGGVGHVGQRIAELHFTPDEDERTSVSFTLPSDSSNPFMPTGLMEKVSQFVESCDLAPSKNLIEQSIHGKNDYKRQAISSLVQLGYLKEEKSGHGMHYSAVKPFREKQFLKAA